MTRALSPYPAASSWLLDKLLKIFNDGQECGPDGVPILKMDFEQVKATAVAFDRKKEKRRTMEKAAVAENGSGKGVVKKRVDAPAKELK